MPRSRSRQRADVLRLHEGRLSELAGVGWPWVGLVRDLLSVSLSVLDVVDALTTEMQVPVTGRQCLVRARRCQAIAEQLTSIADRVRACGRSLQATARDQQAQQ